MNNKFHTEESQKTAKRIDFGGFRTFRNFSNSCTNIPHPSKIQKINFENFKKKNTESKVKFLHKRVKSMTSEIPLSYSTSNTARNLKYKTTKASFFNNKTEKKKEISPIYPTSKKLDYTYSHNFWNTPSRSKRQIGSLTTRVTKSPPKYEWKNNFKSEKIEKLVKKFLKETKEKSAFKDIFCDEEVFESLVKNQNYGKLVEELLMFELHSSNKYRGMVVGSGGR